MLRKCKAGPDKRPAFFHGWFQYGNLEGGLEVIGLIEFEDGTMGDFTPGYITFDTPAIANDFDALEPGQYGKH